MEEKILFEILTELKALNQNLEEIKEIQKESCNFLLQKLNDIEMKQMLYR